MMKPILSLLYFLAVSFVSAADLAALKTELIKTESDFCALGVEKGTPAAFMAYIAPEGIFLGAGPELRGPELVKQRYKDYTAGSILTWTPLVVDVARSGDLGYTTGTFELRSPARDGADSKISHGRYVTIWKRQPDGSWKFVLDGGSADPVKKN